MQMTVFTVMAKVQAVSSKLWQELPQSINGLYGTNITFYKCIIRKQAGKIDIVSTAAISKRQLPFHKDKDFQQSNFFMQILIVSIVYTAGCVE